MAELLSSLPVAAAPQTFVLPELSLRKIFFPTREKRGGDTSCLKRRIGERGSSLVEKPVFRGGRTSALKRFMKRKGSFFPLLLTKEL